MKPLTDRQKKIAAVGVGGLLFLVFMLARGRNAENTQTAASTTSDALPTAVPGGTGQSDFGSGGAVTTGPPDYSGVLGEISSGLDTVGGNQGILYDQLGGLSGSLATTQAAVDALSGQLSTAQDATPAVAPASPVGNAAVAAVRAPAAAAVSKPKTKTVVKNGRVYHFTDTDPKKKGYERKVYVRPAAHAGRSPSRPPAAHHTPPARPTRKPGHGAPTPKPHTKPKKTRR